MTAQLTSPAIDSHIAAFPPETQVVLQQLRDLIRDGAPGATETISYGIPTFDLNGRHLVHFAGYKHHVGFYPTESGILAFQAELRPYKTSRGTVRFPLGQPLPTDLIRRMVAFRVAQVMDGRRAE
jgi:uncharacterized protein YdhG (YjbR/CyaY superfamily)